MGDPLCRCNSRGVVNMATIMASSPNPCERLNGRNDNNNRLNETINFDKSIKHYFLNLIDFNILLTCKDTKYTWIWFYYDTMLPNEISNEIPLSYIYTDLNFLVSHHHFSLPLFPLIAGGSRDLSTKSPRSTKNKRGRTSGALLSLLIKAQKYISRARGDPTIYSANRQTVGASGP